MVTILDWARYIKNSGDSDVTGELTNFIADALDWANPATDHPSSVVTRDVVDLASDADARPLNRLDNFYHEVNCWDAVVKSEKNDAERQKVEALLAAAEEREAAAAKAKAEAQQQRDALVGVVRVGTKKRREAPDEMRGARGALLLTDRAFGWFEEPRDDDDDDGTQGGGGGVASGERAGDGVADDDEGGRKQTAASAPPPPPSSGKSLTFEVEVKPGGKGEALTGDLKTVEEMGKLLDAGRGGVFTF